MAFATPNEVMTQVPGSATSQGSPAIVGIATLAMVESSTCMNVASDSAMVIMTSCAPSSGFCAFALHNAHLLGLSGVGLNDVIDQLIDRIESDFTGVAFISGGLRTWLASI